MTKGGKSIVVTAVIDAPQQHRRSAKETAFTTATRGLKITFASRPIRHLGRELKKQQSSVAPPGTRRRGGKGSRARHDAAFAAKQEAKRMHVTIHK
jgi:hypothetical protein